MPHDIQPVTFTVYASDFGIIHADDVATTLHSLNGHYLNHDIYLRYITAAAEAGRKPGSKKSLGIHLAACGHTPWRTAAARGWTILGS